MFQLPDASDTAGERNHFWEMIIICPGDNYEALGGTRYSRWWRSWTSMGSLKKWQKIVLGPKIWTLKGQQSRSSNQELLPHMLLHPSPPLIHPSATCDTCVILRRLTNFTLLTNGLGLIGTPYLARMTLEANLGWNWPLQSTQSRPPRLHTRQWKT